MDALNPNSPADPSNVMIEDLPQWPAGTSTSSNASTNTMTTVAVQAARLMPAETFEKMSSAERFLAAAVATMASELKPKIRGKNSSQLMKSGVAGLFGDPSTNEVFLSGLEFDELENTFPLMLHCLMICVKEKGKELKIEPPSKWKWTHVLRKILKPHEDDNGAEPQLLDDEVDFTSPEHKKLKLVDDDPQQPMMPLLDIVPVVTGEEDEELLYSNRAKLYRFADSEWRERGQGDIKILKHRENGKVRILMRRDKVLKLSLNHWLSSEMTFLPKGDMKRSYQWYASDFSLEEMRLEHFAVTFKTEIEATEFIDAALVAQCSLLSNQRIRAQAASPGQILAVSTVETLTVLDTSEASSAQFQTPSQSLFVQDSDPSAAFSTNSTAIDITKKSLFEDAMSATTADDDVVIIAVIEAKVTAEEKAQARELQLPENFYAYKRREDCKGCPGCDKEEDTLEPKSIKEKSPPKATSIFGSTTLDNTPNDKSVVNDTIASSQDKERTGFDSGKKQDSESSGEDEGDDAHDPHFNPIFALPDEINVVTGEEDEVIVFCQRGKLYRYDGNMKEWKEKGVGDMKLLLHQATGRYRLLLRRDQVMKVVLNQMLTKDLDMKPLKASNYALCWGALNHAGGELCVEQLAVKFKNEDILTEFKTKVAEAKEQLGTEAV